MKAKTKSQLQIAREKAQDAVNVTNQGIEKLGQYTKDLYQALSALQDHFDLIRNVPTEKKLQVEELKKIRVNWKQQAEKIENDYNAAKVKNAGAGAVGAGMGVAVAAMGPTVAMGIATTFGVASTGTAISALSGVAAQNAALAWLGGGALAAGGGGMAAGKVLLLMTGPVGIAIASAALVASGVMIWKGTTEKKRLEDIFTGISNRDVKSYELAIVELQERIKRIHGENKVLREVLESIRGYGLDYSLMTEKQQYALGASFNMMNSSTQLLINPILGLMPKFSENDYLGYLEWPRRKAKKVTFDRYQDVVIFLANFLYKIELNSTDCELLWKALKNNKELVESMGISKNEFSRELFDAALEALQYQSLTAMKDRIQKGRT